MPSIKELHARDSCAHITFRSVLWVPARRSILRSCVLLDSSPFWPSSPLSPATTARTRRSSVARAEITVGTPPHTPLTHQTST
eukprot:3443520-Pleurochrysis_carterae.AAC.1